MKCPGQDRRYWTGAAAVEVPCPECGAAVEVFRDEGRARCTRCGHRFPNPGTDFGCAQWCSLANECLGFIPQRQSGDDSREEPLAVKLLQLLEEGLKKDPPGLAYALRVFQHARDLVSKEGGDPRVVLTAALWLAADARADRTGGPSGAVAMLPAAESPGSEPPGHPLGLDACTWERVKAILDGYRSGAEPDTIEFKIVADSHRLAALTPETLTDVLAEVNMEVAHGLKTETGRRKAESLRQSRATAPGGGDQRITTKDRE